MNPRANHVCLGDHDSLGAHQADRVRGCDGHQPANYAAIQGEGTTREVANPPTFADTNASRVPEHRPIVSSSSSSVSFYPPTPSPSPLSCVSPGTRRWAHTRAHTHTHWSHQPAAIHRQSVTLCMLPRSPFCHHPRRLIRKVLVLRNKPIAPRYDSLAVKDFDHPVHRCVPLSELLNSPRSSPRANERHRTVVRFHVCPRGS